MDPFEAGDEAGDDFAPDVVAGQRDGLSGELGLDVTGEVVGQPGERRAISDRIASWPAARSVVGGSVLGKDCLNAGVSESCVDRTLQGWAEARHCIATAVARSVCLRLRPDRRRDRS